MMHPRRWLPLAMIATLLLFSTHLQAEDLKTRNSVERLTTPRLKATHEDAERLRKSRRNLTPPAGLIDFRASFHAHAEDSAHTGGTRPEMLAEAKKAGVSVIFLSNHHRPPTDFINDSWRGGRDGVLFIPGSEARGFLISPTSSVMAKMDLPTPEFIKVITANDGLIFLSHIEERVDHPMDGLDGLEIYNRHYDAKRDKAGVLGLVLKMTDPRAIEELRKNLELYPDEVFAFHCGRQPEYLDKWDLGLKGRRLTGVAANDCHHNQILLTKMVDETTVLVGTNVDKDEQMQKVKATLRPSIRQLTKGHKPGDILARIDLDPYHRTFRNASTHILASSLDETTIRAAVRGGRVYVAHDWVCDPAGFSFTLEGPDGKSHLMGDEVTFAKGQSVRVKTTAPCRLKLIAAGKVVAEGKDVSDWTAEIPGPGAYRVEASVILDGEERPWIYANPIYVR